MSLRGEKGIFVERKRYRQRRLVDGLRFLPVVAAWLFMLPLLWPVADAAPDVAKPMSSALVYVFWVWVSLIVVAACLSFAIWSYDDHDGAEQDAER